MSRAFHEIAFTAAVQRMQLQDGSRGSYARAVAGKPAEARIGPREAEYIAEQRSLYLATVSETGWPYVQHRGGPPGFLKVLDDRMLAFADYAGNRQFVSVGNLAGSDKVALILVDYVHRRRLKILGHATVTELVPGDPVHAALIDKGYAARPQRAVVIRVAGFDWNCPQHLPRRIDFEDVQHALEARDARIAALEAQLAAARAG